jgi:DNA damage-binding protein 1
MLNYSYVVAAHRSSKVSHTAVGNFRHHAQRNLLVAKVTTVEVYTIAPEGLTLSVKLPIYGRIASMLLYRCGKNGQEDLLILTEKHRLFALHWNGATNLCETTMVCEVKDTLGSSVERAPITVLDPKGRCAALQQYQHLLKFVPLVGKEPQAFNVRLTDDDVIDIVFLHGCAQPTIAVLARDSEDRFYVKSYEVSLSEQDMAVGPWGEQSIDVDAGATMLLPMPAPSGGVLVIAEQTVAYMNGPGGDGVSCSMEPAIIKAVGPVDEDGSRFLLGDHMGRLKMLVLGLDGSQKAVSSVEVQALGETSIASSISYCDNSYVYIGSDLGDSQLIRLDATRGGDDDPMGFVEVVQSYDNLGPITDFCVMKGGGQVRQGQGQVVTCSGGSKDGSLRVIRNGIGISEQARVELPGIKEMWALRRHFGDKYHSYLVPSFASETFVFELHTGSDLGESDLTNVDQQAATLFMANLVGDLIVQVTAAGVNVLDCKTLAEADGPAWAPPAGSSVLVATGNASQLVLATTGGNLVYLEVDEASKALVERGYVRLDNEIACIDCTPLGDVGEHGRPVELRSNVAAVGLWAGASQQPSVQLIALPELTTVCTVSLEGDIMARSVLMATLEGFDYILIALGDGHLLSFKYADIGSPSGFAQDTVTMTAPGKGGSKAASVLFDKRRLSVGTQPAQLSLFRSRGGNHVFAACDRPTVVYAERGGGKLLVSNVNLEQVSRVCEFNTSDFPENLAIATDGALQIGAVDEIQKLHLRTVHLNEQPRRIVHMESAHVFGLLTEATCVDSEGDEALECTVRLICETTFDCLTEFKLGTDEVSSSICVTGFKGDGVDESVQYLVVGTGIVPPNEPESHSGRLMFFSVLSSSGKAELKLVAEHSIRGVAYTLAPFDGRLLAGVNSLVQLFSISLGENGLQIAEDATYHGNVLVLRLAVRGDFALAGDLMRSVTLLRKRTMGGKGLEQLSRDYDTAWTMAMEFISDDSFVIAEMSKNLITLQRTSHAASDTERMKLERTGLFHVGALVNKIARGSLVMQMPEDTDSPAIQTMLFGTADGMLGVIATLTTEDYEFFSSLQTALAKTPGLGNIMHADWRQFVSDSPARAMAATRYIDGDLVETFLELPPEHARALASEIGVSVEDITRRCEAMQRLH